MTTELSPLEMRLLTGVPFFGYVFDEADDLPSCDDEPEEESSDRQQMQEYWEDFTAMEREDGATDYTEMLAFREDDNR